MGKFIELLEKEYQQYKAHNECPPDDRVEFIGHNIFDFTTYEGSTERLFGKKMLDVIDCILNRRTFDYQGISHDNYINYLIMVNMPFLKDKLEWGTSIRGAWFESRAFEIQCTDIKVKPHEIPEFMGDLLIWSKYEMDK